MPPSRVTAKLALSCLPGQLAASAAGYTLMQGLRRFAMAGTELAHAEAATIHRRLRDPQQPPHPYPVGLSHPERETFLTATRALAP